MSQKISLLAFAERIASSIGIHTLKTFGQYSLFDHSEEQRRKDEECFRHIFNTLQIYLDSERKVFFKIKNGGDDKDHFFPVNHKTYLSDLLSIQRCIENHFKGTFLLEEENVELFFDEKEALDFLADSLDKQRPSKKEMLEKCERYFEGLTRHLKTLLCVGEQYSLSELEALNGLKEKNLLSVLKKKINFEEENIKEEDVARICKFVLIENYHCLEAGPQTHKKQKI